MERSTTASVGAGTLLAIFQPALEKLCAAGAAASHTWSTPWTDALDFTATAQFQAALIVLVMGLLTHFVADTSVRSPAAPNSESGANRP